MLLERGAKRNIAQYLKNMPEDKYSSAPPKVSEDRYRAAFEADRACSPVVDSSYFLSARSKVADDETQQPEDILLEQWQQREVAFVACFTERDAKLERCGKELRKIQDSLRSQQADYLFLSGAKQRVSGAKQNQDDLMKRWKEKEAVFSTRLQEMELEASKKDMKLEARKKEIQKLKAIGHEKDFQILLARDENQSLMDQLKRFGKVHGLPCSSLSTTASLLSGD